MAPCQSTHHNYAIQHPILKDYKENTVDITSIISVSVAKHRIPAGSDEQATAGIGLFYGFRGGVPLLLLLLLLFPLRGLLKEQLSMNKRKPFRCLHQLHNHKIVAEIFNIKLSLLLGTTNSQKTLQEIFSLKSFATVFL